MDKIEYRIIDTGEHIPGQWFGWEILLNGKVIDRATDHRSERLAKDEARRMIGYWEKNVRDGMVRKPFRGAWAFLSNFYEHYMPVEIGGERIMTTSESWYQAKKCVNLEDARRILALPPGMAKGEERKVQIRPDWDAIKLDAMAMILSHKFAGQAMLEKLLSTQDELLIEWNSWHDCYWGKCICDKCNNQGQNHLGRLLMQLRELAQHSVITKQVTEKAFAFVSV